MNADYLARLREQVPASWWSSDEGAVFLRQEKLIDAWVELLGRFEYDCFFTLTFRNPATSSILAIDRASRLLTKFFKSIHHPLRSFVVAEQHQSGLYHVHGLLHLGALSSLHAEQILTALWKAGFDRFGRCSFELVQDPSRVRSYVSKYLIKKVCDHRFVP